MECALCKKPIKEYHPKLNHLEIDENTSADICSDCIEKFVNWRGKVIAELFPTKLMKKRFGKS